MKNKIICTLAVIMLLCSGRVFAGGKQEAGGEPAAGVVESEPEIAQTETTAKATDESVSLTITDCMEREVTVQRPVKRIAFSHSATADALMILDAWDMVAGRCQMLDEAMFPDLDNIPVVKSGQNVYELNYEEIYEAGIDLFIAADIPVSGFDDMVATLEPAIPVVALNFHDSSQFITNLEKLGRLLGKEKEAEEYIQWFNTIVDQISTKTTSLEEKPKVFFKTGWGSIDDIQTFTDDFSGIPERNDITGCINIAADLPSTGGWIPSVDSEWLATRDMDILIVMDTIPGGFGLGIDDNTLIRNHREQVMAFPAFSGSNAVKNNCVYMIPVGFYATPQFIVEYAYLAKWFHPDLFNDLEPQAIHHEYLSKFMRIDFDLSKHGVFVYPEE
jgi:iron complex transport system substrate-binding protein